MLNARGGVHDSLINPLARRSAPRGYFTVVRRNSGLSSRRELPGPATMQVADKRFYEPFRRVDDRKLPPHRQLCRPTRAGNNSVIREGASEWCPNSSWLTIDSRHPWGVDTRETRVSRIHSANYEDATYQHPSLGRANPHAPRRRKPSSSSQRLLHRARRSCRSPRAVGRGGKPSVSKICAKREWKRAWETAKWPRTRIVC